jgi:large-conductance mechanosensitive channel
MPKLFLIVLFCGMNLYNAQGQLDSTIVQYDRSILDIQEISEEDLQIYRDDPDFDYEIVKADLTWWDKFLNWLADIFSWLINLLSRFFEWLFGVEKAAGYLAIFFDIIPYILIAILLFLLIKFFLNVNARALTYSRKNQTIVALSEDEHIIKNEDIDQLIRQALKDKNYRLAIRYYYLLLLKSLGHKEYIVWELQKTNEDYINEIEKPNIKEHFGRITRLYDYIWYGGFDIDKANYQIVEATFLKLKKSLDTNG